MMKTNLGRGSMVLAGFLMISGVSGAWAGAGTEGAAFLNIPVGAGPAAMGAAYTALAHDAYASVYNPSGLGFVTTPQMSGQHLSYLESIHYEHASFALPLTKIRGGLGGSIQYLGSGDNIGRDTSGNETGDFSSYYSAYNLSYGQRLTDKLSLGLTGKMIYAKLDDATASAYAADLGATYKPANKVTVATSLTNVGSKLKFVEQGDDLPLAFHVGAAYQPSVHWTASVEAVYPKTGEASAHVGGAWRPVDMMSIRAGYRTDTIKENSPLAGASAGIGLHLWSQELAYAWVPYGDLGETHYITLLMKFGNDESDKRNLIRYQKIQKHRMVKKTNTSEMEPEYQQLIELLENSEQKIAGTDLEQDRN